MTSRERIIAAIKKENTDHTPILLGFWPPIAKISLSGGNERKRLETHRVLGLDRVIGVKASPIESPYYGIAPFRHIYEFPKGITAEVEQLGDEKYGSPLIKKTIHTPGGALTAIVKRTEDWPWGNDIPLTDDFNPSRYVKPWVQDKTDADLLGYLLQPPGGEIKDRIIQEIKEVKETAEDFGAAVCGINGNGLDFVCWLCGIENAVVMSMLQPKIVTSLLGLSRELDLYSLQILGEMNVDYILRRGWYESADFWSPDLYKKFAQPLLEEEVQAAHDLGKPLVYLMSTGIEPLLQQISEVPFDMLSQFEPSSQDLKMIFNELGDTKSFHGGISAHHHLQDGTPDVVRRAVRESFNVFEHMGFVLGCSASIRDDFPWENVDALIDEWRTCENRS